MDQDPNSEAGNEEEYDEIPTRITDLLVADFVEGNTESLNRADLKNLAPSVIKGLGTVYGFRLERLEIKTIENLSDQLAIKELTDKLAVDEETVLKWLLGSDIIAEYSKGGENYRSVAPVPTKGVHKEYIEFLKVDVPIIELGGAAEQREKYITEPQTFLKDAMLLIYVIDVTKASLMHDNIDYLKDLIDSMKAIGEVPNLRILLNKYDPQYRHQNDAVVNHISARVHELFESEYKIISKEVYKTSIFEIPTLIAAFSALFRDLTPISMIIASIYQYFAGLSSVYAGFVFTENGFVVSEWTKRLPEERRNRIFDEAYNYIKKNVNKEDVHQAVITTVYQGIFIIIERIDIEGAKLFLTSINTKAEAIGDQNLKLLRNQFKPWIKNFFAIRNKREIFIESEEE
ncbi:MAG: ADP-ribosylation factor-like protein [Candidatus Hodarchaeales archaeon]